MTENRPTKPFSPAEAATSSRSSREGRWMDQAVTGSQYRTIVADPPWTPSGTLSDDNPNVWRLGSVANHDGHSEDTRSPLGQYGGQA